MRTMSIDELRCELERLEELLGSEGELLITRGGRPMARVLPGGPLPKRPSHADLRAAMPRLEAGSEVDLRQDRNER